LLRNEITTERDNDFLDIEEAVFGSVGFLGNFHFLYFENMMHYDPLRQNLRKPGVGFAWLVAMPPRVSSKTSLTQGARCHGALSDGQRGRVPLIGARCLKERSANRAASIDM
jgi:hypothetical protein